MSIKRSMKNKRIHGIVKKIKRLFFPAKTSDFRSGVNPHTLILREKTWRIELNHTNLRRFLRKHRLGLICCVILLVGGIALRYSLVGFASTADFYPSLCMGSWQNVQNALGKPDVPFGAPGSAFTDANSAIFTTSTNQIFCGNFSGADSGGKIFQSATLRLSWFFNTASTTPSPSVTMPSSSTAPSGGGSSFVAPSEFSASTTQSTSTDSSSSTEIEEVTPSSTTDDTAASDTASSTTSLSLPASDTPPAATGTIPTSSLTDDMAGPNSSSSTIASSTPPSTPSSTPASAPAEDDASTSISTTPPPTPPASDDDASSSTSFNDLFRYLIPTAYAAPAFSQPPPLVSASSSTGDSAGDEDIATSTLIVSTTTTSTIAITSSTIPLNLITIPSSSVPVESSGTQDILQVNVSLDGKTWTTLGNIDASNWQDASFVLPVSSWQDLQDLQVSILGFDQSGTLVQSVYLDGMDVVVAYEDADSLQGATTVAAPSAEQLPPSLPPPPPKTFDAQAKQTCSVTPYAEAVQAGGSSTFPVSLDPSATPPPPFIVQIGELPTGVSGSVVTSTADPLMPQILLSADDDASQGSFNVIVLYQEEDASGTTVSNYCQFNLLVQ